MEFSISDILEFPQQQVYITYRDRLPELVPYMENVDDLKVVQRDDEVAGGPKLVNRWKVNGSIPRAVRPFFSDKMLTYLDHAQWDDEQFLVHWYFEIGVFPDAVECSGTNYFKPGPRPESTEVTLTGALKVDLSKVRGVPRFLHRLAPKVEKFVLGRVRPNLGSVTQAVARFLADSSG